MRLPAIFYSSKTYSLKIKHLSSYHHHHHHHQEQVKRTRGLLKSCSSSLSLLKNGKSIHASTIKQGLHSFTSIHNSLLDFYVKLGHLHSAIRVFDYTKTSRDSVSWNILINGYVKFGFFRQGLLLFNEAKATHVSFQPNVSTLVLVVQCCCRAGGSVGQQVHGYLVRSGFYLGDSAVRNSLLTMYASSDMVCAERLFDEMPDRDVISWSVMINGYVAMDEARDGLRLFREMLIRGIQPDGLTIVSVLKACSAYGVYSCEGRLVHGFVITRGFIDDLFVGNSLIDMYSKCKDVNSASQVFCDMPRKNHVSWNSTLSGFVLNEKHDEAMTLLQTMYRENIVADDVTLVNVLQICQSLSHCKSAHCAILRLGYEWNKLVINSLVNAYAKFGLVEVACELFNGMKTKDVVLWSTMIACLSRCGKPDEAIALFQEMNLKPNGITVINLLEACSNLAELRKSKWAHAIAIRRCLASEVTVGTAIVDMYSKCGAIEESRKAFDQIFDKNIISWSAMIAAYGMNGASHEALALLNEMKLCGVKANAVTTLSILSACSHGGLVEEGISFFKSMARDHGVDPGMEHYSCLVDMLARAGNLDCAMQLIKIMPEGLMGSSRAWGALLSASRKHGNKEIGIEAASRVLKLEPLNSAGYMITSNLFAAGESWVNAAQIRRIAKERRVRVVAGYSLVNVGEKAHRFVAGDKSHSCGCDLSSVVNNLHECMTMMEEVEASLF
ncbi:hypothetical protein ACFE04_016202 [Oxalis oulophora]